MYSTPGALTRPSKKIQTIKKFSGQEESLWVRYFQSSNIQTAKDNLTGGSSCVNFYCWVKPPAQDIDAFEKLGNPGWNWEDYDEYSRKIETYVLHSTLPNILERNF